MATEHAPNGGTVKHTPHFPSIANPAPLGLMSFALTTFVLSCYNAGIFGLSVSSPPNVVTGLALFYGGLSQLLAGMWEFKTGNTFGATAFASYGGFWLSYAAILIPWFGVVEGYSSVGYERDLAPALAVFLLGWTIFTALMWLGTLRTNVVLSALFASLTLTFLLLTVAEYKGNGGLRVKRAGGFFGIITAIIAWYLGLAGVLTHENCFFTLPVGPLKRRHS
jgi:succinate-acetate transporter protein